MLLALERRGLGDRDVGERLPAEIERVLTRWDDALADSEAALRINPTNAWALFERGVAKRRNGDLAGGDVRETCGLGRSSPSFHPTSKQDQDRL